MNSFLGMDVKIIIQFFIDGSYLGASVLFILGLKGLSHPDTARRGMYMAEVGMLLAIIGTLLNFEVVDLTTVFVGLVLGSIIGVGIAMWTPMTAMPQRTALSHACGALAVTLVGIAKYHHLEGHLNTVEMTAVGFEVLFGSLTVTGSLIAMGKLQGVIKGTPITFPGQNAFNISLFFTMFAMYIYLIIDPVNPLIFYLLTGLGFLFGILLVIPIGAADMPVVISLLNSYAGLAACATGFALNNKVLIIGGALDGASGFILSIIMCKAMNRSITNVLFGAFGKVDQKATQFSPGTIATSENNSGLPYREIKMPKAVDVFRRAKSVIVVPGYGMAVAQAQHSVREFTDLLKERGATIKYAIHPVAGRMPGHMNVLLAEANVPYDELIEMEEINPEFEHTDIALVIGANDVTNPAARSNPSSPIYGMPILEVDKAKQVIVIKRSMNPGFAGIDNDLYTTKNTAMLFGDAKQALQKLINEFKEAELRGPAAMQIDGAEGIKDIKAKEVAGLFKQAKNVIIVPGYGMAVSQAQHGVRELADVLKARGVKIKYAIHPVAGRMPGHMNVLLAEANVPYDELIDMEEINPEFEHTDIALVIGANDVTNPAARTNSSSPIYGMPILEVDKSRCVIVIKRGMNPGFAGIENDLYTLHNTFMYFGDAKSALNNLLNEFKEA